MKMETENEVLNQFLQSKIQGSEEKLVTNVIKLIKTNRDTSNDRDTEINMLNNSLSEWKGSTLQNSNPFGK